MITISKEAQEFLDAERELASFRQAVLKMHGPEEAQRASEYWIEELESAACLDKPKQFRRISVKAAAKLASKLAAKSTRTRARSVSIFDLGDAKRWCHTLT